MNDGKLTLRERVSELPLSGKVGVELRNIGDAFALAELFSEAKILPRNSKGEQISVESAAVRIIAGYRLGLDALESVNGIAEVNGRPTIWGDSMVSVCRASGLVEYIKKDEFIDNEHPEKSGIICTVKRKGDETLYQEIFTVGDAQRAGLWNKTLPWKSYPRRMLFSRARAFALRDAFADVLKGFRPTEEEKDLESMQEAQEEEERKQEEAVQEAKSAPKTRKRSKAAEALLQAASMVTKNPEVPEEPIVLDMPEQKPKEKEELRLDAEQ